MIRSLIKSSTFSTLTSVVAYGLTIILARNESQLAFAELTYAIAWGLIFTQMIDLAATQCMSHFKISTGESIDNLVANILGAKLVALGIAIAAIAAASAIEQVEIPATTVFFLVPAFYLGPVFELRSQNVLFASLLFVEKSVLLLFCFLYLRYNPIDQVIYVAYFGVAATSLVIQFVALGLRFPNLRRMQRALFARYAGMYWAIYLTLGSQVVYGHISRVIIEAKLGMLAFAAVSLALQIVNAMKIVQTQVDRHLRPRIAELVKNGDGEATRRLTIGYVIIYLLPLAAGCVLLVLVADDVIRLLFGPDWAPAGEFLQYLSPLIVTIAILRYLDMFVVALGLGRANLTINLIAAGLLVAVLLSIPAGRDTSFYLFAVVGVQVLHIVALMLYFLHRYLRAGKMSVV